MNNMKTSKVILCIDDEKIILESLKSQLMGKIKGDFIFEFAESAEEGMELIQSLAQDGYEIYAVVCDWLMPGMKGDEFLNWIHENYKNCVKILLTGHVDNDVVKTLECCNTQEIHCIYKPWDEDKLLKLIVS